MTLAAINLKTGASINGRLLAQTAVTLDASTVTEVVASPPNGIQLQSTPALTLTNSFTYAEGQSVNLAAQTITVPMDGNTQFYRIVADTALTLTNITINANNVTINYK